MTTSSDEKVEELSTPNHTDLIDLDDSTPQVSGVQRLSISSDQTKGKEAVEVLSEKEDLPPSYQTITKEAQRAFKAVNYVDSNRIHFLIAASGSLSIEILPAIIKELENSAGVTIRVVLDKVAQEHASAQALLKLPRVRAVYTDADWQGQNRDLHHELRSWLDFMLVVPCDQSTMAKITHGIGDDLLTTILRTFDAKGNLNPPGRHGRFKYLAIAPAMDSATWLHPVTREQIILLENTWSYTRPFTSGPVPWCVIVRPRDYPKAIFNASEDNCNMDMARIMMETRWQLSKFLVGHKWYVQGN